MGALHASSHRRSSLSLKAQWLDQLSDPDARHLRVAAHQRVDLILEQIKLMAAPGAKSRLLRRALCHPDRVARQPGAAHQLLDRDPANEVLPAELSPAHRAQFDEARLASIGPPSILSPVSPNAKRRSSSPPDKTELPGKSSTLGVSELRDVPTGAVRLAFNAARVQRPRESEGSVHRLRDACALERHG